MNWFGRLLMWCGCSSACMTKVAKFLEQNMHALSSTAKVDLNDDQNPIGDLLKRVKKFSDNHPKKISQTAFNIECIYNLVLDKAKRNQLSVVLSAPGLSQKPVLTIPAPAPLQQPLARPVATIPLPASPTLPAQPIAPAPAPAPTPPPPPRLKIVQESIDRFKAARGHIGDVADYLQNNGVSGNAAKNSKAAEEMEKVQQLIKDCSQDPARFAAVVREMSVDEVTLYVAFGVGDQSVAVDTAIEIFKDIFKIKDGSRFTPSSSFSLAVQHMSVDQLKAVVRSIAQYGRSSFFCSREDMVYTLTYLILQFRSSADQDMLFAEIVKQPCYGNSIFQTRNPVWSSPSTGPNTQLKIETLLAEYYLFYILRDLAIKQNPGDRAKLIADFVERTHFCATGIACNSPVQNRIFLPMSIPEQNDLALAMVEKANDAKALVGSVLIKEVMLVTTQRMAILFPAIISHLKHSEFCTALRLKKPNCDAQYVFNLLQTFDRDNLKNFIKGSGLPDTNSTIECVDFIQKTINKAQVIFLAGIIVEASFDKADPIDNDWSKYYVIREKIMKDARLAQGFYEAYKTSQHFDINLFLAYCKDTAPAIFQAIVGNMSLPEKGNWDTYQIQQFLDSAAYKSLTPAEQQKAYRDFFESL